VPLTFRPSSVFTFWRTACFRAWAAHALRLDSVSAADARASRPPGGVGHPRWRRAIASVGVVSMMGGNDGKAVSRAPMIGPKQENQLIEWNSLLSLRIDPRPSFAAFAPTYLPSPIRATQHRSCHHGRPQTRLAVARLPSRRPHLVQLVHHCLPSPLRLRPCRSNCNHSAGAHCCCRRRLRRLGHRQRSNSNNNSPFVRRLPRGRFPTW